MLNDLVNPTTNLPPTTKALAKLARRVLVAVSVVIGVGLAGVVFARGTVERRGGLVWVVRGHPVVVNFAAQSDPSAAAPVTLAQPARDGELLHDAQVTRTHVVTMDVTAYCPCAKCCGPKAQGLTASGKPVTHNGGVFVAADTRKLPFGTKLTIPGYGDGRAVEVIDRGGAIKGDKIDVFFPTHAEALRWGRQKIAVTVHE